MPHDIYSLGVVLLELGLWQSFLSFLPPTDPARPYETADPDTAIPPPFLQVLDSEKDTRKRATAVKGALTTLATEMLPARMGRKYTDVVLLCLRCLDGAVGEEGVGAGRALDGEEGFVDEDGIVVGVRYIERILLRMQEISI
jgi:hypothetical protein